MDVNEILNFKANTELCIENYEKLIYFQEHFNELTRKHIIINLPNRDDFKEDRK